ncbi:uncharacterized protein VTP21DRAFT_2195 [Calcarisporiella thermophila]|uniref:uncharacterized protein n=1 Tax=Calcarisporiella thermophila TaxID=911321 RepID=UPI003742F7B6
MLQLVHHEQQQRKPKDSAHIKQKFGRKFAFPHVYVKHVEHVNPEEEEDWQLKTPPKTPELPPGGEEELPSKEFIVAVKVQDKEREVIDNKKEELKLEFVPALVAFLDRDKTVISSLSKEFEKLANEEIHNQHRWRLQTAARQLATLLSPTEEFDAGRIRNIVFNIGREHAAHRIIEITGHFLDSIKREERIEGEMEFELAKEAYWDRPSDMMSLLRVHRAACIIEHGVGEVWTKGWVVGVGASELCQEDRTQAAQNLQRLRVTLNRLSPLIQRLSAESAHKLLLHTMEAEPVTSIGGTPLYVDSVHIQTQVYKALSDFVKNEERAMTLDFAHAVAQMGAVRKLIHENELCYAWEKAGHAVKKFILNPDPILRAKAVSRLKQVIEALPLVKNIALAEEKISSLVPSNRGKMREGGIRAVQSEINSVVEALVTSIQKTGKLQYNYCPLTLLTASSEAGIIADSWTQLCDSIENLFAYAVQARDNRGVRQTLGDAKAQVMDLLHSVSLAFTSPSLKGQPCSISYAAVGALYQLLNEADHFIPGGENYRAAAEGIRSAKLMLESPTEGWAGRDRSRIFNVERVEKSLIEATDDLRIAVSKRDRGVAIQCAAEAALACRDITHSTLLTLSHHPSLGSDHDTLNAVHGCPQKTKVENIRLLEEVQSALDAVFTWLQEEPSHPIRAKSVEHSATWTSRACQRWSRQFKSIGAEKTWGLKQVGVVRVDRMQENYNERGWSFIVGCKEKRESEVRTLTATAF